MKLSKNSLSVKLYKITYDSPLPSNLCPYFWELVWAIIISPINLILQLFGNLLGLFIGKPNNNLEARGIGFVTIFGLVLVIGYTYITYEMFKGMFNCYYYVQIASILGGIFNSIFILIILIWLIGKYIGNKVEDKTYILLEYLEAKKNKYCPKIDWE